MPFEEPLEQIGVVGPRADHLVQFHVPRLGPGARDDGQGPPVHAALVAYQFSHRPFRTARHRGVEPGRAGGPGEQRALASEGIHVVGGLHTQSVLASEGKYLEMMPIAPHIQRLRALVGHELLVLPGAAVLPRDGDGRVLLVRTIDDDRWAAIGGAIEPDESPEQAALREAREEAGVSLRLGPVLAVLGGPDYRMTYPNGD